MAMLFSTSILEIMKVISWLLDYSSFQWVILALASLQLTMWKGKQSGKLSTRQKPGKVLCLNYQKLKRFDLDNCWYLL